MDWHFECNARSWRASSNITIDGRRWMCSTSPICCGFSSCPRRQPIRPGRADEHLATGQRRATSLISPVGDALISTPCFHQLKDSVQTTIGQDLRKLPGSMTCSPSLRTGPFQSRSGTVWFPCSWISLTRVPARHRAARCRSHPGRPRYSSIPLGVLPAQIGFHLACQDLRIEHVPDGGS